MAEASANPNLILPIGTQVVTLVEKRSGKGAVMAAGAVGFVVKCPVDHSHAYRIRFPSGAEVSFRRKELAIRKQIQRQGAEESVFRMEDHDLSRHVIYRCVTGSRAYGLDTETSDTDRRGIYLPPAELHWSLYGVPEQLEQEESQECYWELQKFLNLALRANPNVLECLFTPLVEWAAPLAEELLAMRSVFLSRLIYQTYNGYVLSQFKKLEADWRTTGAPKWKHAMHLIRLLRAGVVALRTGTIPVRVDDQRDRLLAIRRGETPWEEIETWRLDLHREFDAALKTTALPERPDYARVNDFLIRARRSALNSGL